MPERKKRKSCSSSPSPKKRQRLDEFYEMKSGWKINRLFSLDKGPRNFAGINLPIISKTTLLIDTKEPNGNEMKEILNALGLRCELKPLECGDYMWIGGGYSFDCSIERKTVEDLKKSLRDGRFKRQNENMRKYKMRNLFYLIEGADPREEDLARVTGEGFEIIRTQNTNDTLEFLINTTVEIDRYIKGGDYKKLFFVLDENEEGRRGPFKNYHEK